MNFSNQTFHDMNRLREFFKAIGASVKMMKTDKELRGNFDALINLAKSPLVQAILGGAVDIPTIEMVLNSVLNDTRIDDVIDTVGNIFECFSVDRFIAVGSESELEDLAFELGKKKLFYAGIYFTKMDASDTSYKLRMEVDNTPVTIENKNRFWFPGAEGSFELEMRYHRGFIQIQNAVDMAIIKHKKKKFYESTRGNSTDDLDFSDLEYEHDGKGSDDSDEFDLDDDFGGLKLDQNGEFGDDNRTTTQAPTTQAPGTTEAPSSLNFDEIFKAFQSKVNISQTDVDKYNDDSDFWNFEDDDEPLLTEAPTTNAPLLTEAPTTNAPSQTEPPTTSSIDSEFSAEETPKTTRKKRQLDGILGLISGAGGGDKKKTSGPHYEVDDLTFYTKQMPYPKHLFDAFKKGL